VTNNLKISAAENAFKQPALSVFREAEWKIWFTALNVEHPSKKGTSFV
jgi:hypothetical protein